MNVRGAFLHALGDALSSLGVIAGAAAMAFTGWLILDPLISIAISGVIIFGAYRLVRDAVEVLLEATPAHVDLEAVRELMELRSSTGIVVSLGTTKGEIAGLAGEVDVAAAFWS